MTRTRVVGSGRASGLWGGWMKLVKSVEVSEVDVFW